MATELENLVELQDVDLELARLRAQLAAIPETLKRIDAQLATARKRVEDIRVAIKAGEGEKRQHEQDIRSLNEMIVKFRGQSSSIKNNEQYKALLSEIAHAEAEIAGHEEKIIEVLVKSDALQVELAAAEAALKAESVEIDRQKQAAEKLGDADREAIARGQERSRKLRAGVDETLLASYDRVLRSRGRALAELIDHRCTACQVMVRPQTLSLVRAADEIVHCDSCGRLLYYIPEHNVKTASANATGITHQAEREWMFVPSMGAKGAFVVFINHKGSATMKAYDAVTGDVIARRVEKNAICASIFAEEIRDARNLFVDEHNLDEQYKERLPQDILDDLRHQLPNV